ncbi:MAG: TetR/AcrR family transcriptional regulator [Spirochaetia bacterium]
MKQDARKSTRDNRERIIQTAAKLIIERGIASTSLADIARAAEISKGTLFYYYPTKADLIFDITERHMEHMSQKIFRWVEDASSDVPPEKILKLVFDTITSSQARGQIHVYLIQEALTNNPHLRQRFGEEYKRWRAIIERGLERLLPSEEDYSTLSWIILGLIDGFLLQSLLGTERLPLDETAGYFTRNTASHANTVSRHNATSTRDMRRQRYIPHDS